MCPKKSNVSCMKDHLSLNALVDSRLLRHARVGNGESHAFDVDTGRSKKQARTTP